MNSRVKVKVVADQNTAKGLRTLVTKITAAEIASTPEDVQTIAWLLEMAREISVAGASQLQLAKHIDPARGHEMVLIR